MDSFAGPTILVLVAAVIVVLKYRRRTAGGTPLLAASGTPGRIAVAVAFAIGCAWAWSQGPSVVNAGVLGLSLALLAGVAAEFLARRSARRM
ncbi:hypothetical protein [Streptomyces aureus]|uniref:hypothetical protein n=1 Tax=Streptomyces aureus TaxID=193461 RepID=UPI00055EE038|nr:hypothetical protein [Streptomyces aureus]